ncbi:MAG TPA: nuclear transport factor 2 family protein [Pyrinomonadaceae bacterium]|jgi:ketosteroid isomerase-like protein|nr:nuclear transport factor 2 family protein [Pyrinomonadaceae bacterium]
MVTTIAIVTALMLSALTVAQKQNQRTQNRNALVEMEHAFAKAAATKGTRDAFLEFLADDGILFQPGPVNGKKLWSERQPRKGLLSWEPVFADVSGAGDLGYTTGPWEFRPNGPADQPVAFGQYFTIWKKQNDGAWKAVLDRGVTSEQAFPRPPLSFPGDEKTEDGTGRSDRTAARASLMKLETEFSNASALNARTAFESFLADDARVLRQNAAPAVGKLAVGKLMPEAGRALTWQVALADASASGDLGYTYGSFELNTRGVTLQRGSYVRVWKKLNGKWKVVVDVMSPDPKE